MTSLPPDPGAPQDVTVASVARFLVIIARQLRSDGLDVPLVLLDADGVGPAQTLSWHLELAALNLDTDAVMAMPDTPEVSS